MQHPNRILKDFKRLHLLYKKGAVFTAFDTETSSLSPSNGRIIEIGAVKFDKNGIIQKYQQLFNPQLPLSPDIENLTHITNQMLQTSPKIEECLPQFLQMIKGTILIAHNAQFDLNFLNFECENMNLKASKNPTIDTLQYSYFKLPKLEKHKLDFLADYFKINKGSSHRAFDDANTCMELFKILVTI
ncbi:MAG: 3'-5' exonuclease [Treponema sp.]|nr:3'-5' exonuclease [Treponema sp.]